jgi:hypothetical protein
VKHPLHRNADFACPGHYRYRYLTQYVKNFPRAGMELIVSYSVTLNAGIGPEATSLEYKHVGFRKPQCSATEKFGVECVQNVEKVLFLS